MQLGSGAGTVTPVIQRSLVHSRTTCQTVLDCDTEPRNKLRILCANVCDVPIDHVTAIGWMRIHNEGSKVTKIVLLLKQVTVQMSHVCSDPPVLGHLIVPALQRHLERFCSAVTSQRCQLTDTHAAPHARLMP